ncbi:MAG: PAS domain S-box protein [Breznakibacter sp.]
MPAKASVIEIDKNFRSFLITHQALHFEDPDKLLTAQQVLSQTFQPCNSRIPNYGFSLSAHWFRIDLKSLVQSDTMFVYDIKNHYLENVEVYWVTDTIKLIQKGGASTKSIGPDAITLAPLQAASLLVKVESRTPIRVPIFLQSNEYYWQAYGNTRLINGLYYGVFGILILLSIYLLATYRELIYLTFGLCTISWLWLILGIDNTIPIMRQWDDPSLLLKSSSMSTPVSAIFYLYYTVLFFNTSIKLVRRTLLVSMGTMILLLIVYFIDFHFANKLSYITIPLLSLLVMGLSGYMYIGKDVKFARYHLLGSIMLLIGIFLHTLSYRGVISNYWVMLLSFKSGFLLLLCIFILALLDKYIITQHNFTSRLQNTVAERTQELTRVNNSLQENIRKLNEANAQLSVYKHNLEKEVEERTEALIATLTSLQSIIDSSPLAIFDIGRDNRILSVWNPAAEQLFGWQNHEAIGKRIEELNMYFLKTESPMSMVLSGGNPIPYLEATVTSKTGREVDTRVALAPIATDTLPAERIIVMMDDITEHKTLLREIESNELKFRTLYESISLGILLMSPDMEIIEHNPAISRIFGYPSGHLQGRQLYSLFKEGMYPKISKAQHRLINDGVLPHFEFDAFHANHQPLVLEIWGNLLTLGDEKLILVVVKDITEQKRFNQKLVETIIETEEKERRRFAGDLHDELGPQLASMRIYASSLKKRAKSHDEVEILDTLMELIKRTIDNVRELSNNLSPHLLDTYGLVSAITMESERKAHIFTSHFTHNLASSRLEKNVEINIYRIVKELLNNTMKYAGASQVNIHMELKAKTLQLKYGDDGKGFDYRQLMKHGTKGIGLMNIKSRVDSLGGECVFQSMPGNGFQFFLTVPVNEIS